MQKRVIELKNGKHIELEWSFLVLEYLDEYPGGTKQVQKEIRSKQISIKLTNYLCYAVVRANINEPLTYEEIVKLLNLKAVKAIMGFIEANSEEFEEFKKKDQTYLYKKKRKKKN